MTAIVNVQPAAAVSPPTGRALLPIVSAAIHYPLHGSVAEASAYGGPALTLNGTVGTLWSANWGAATPDGATHYATAATGNAVLNEIFDLTDLNGQQVLVGFELQTDGDLSGSEVVVGWGSNSGGIGVGGWNIGLNSAEQVSVGFRGIGSSGESTNAIGSTAMATTDRYAVVVSLTGTSVSECTIEVARWQFGTGLLTTIQQTAISTYGTAGTSAPGVNSTYALTLMARRGASAYERFLGATAGSNAKLNNVWAARVLTPSVSLAEQCVTAMGAAPRDFPLTLRA
jgi:hypothetical protein